MKQYPMALKSVVDFVSEQLRERILQGHFTPGQKIKEVDTALEFKVSRPPIREAFKILESEGLISIRPRYGAFVAEFTEKDIWEVYTIIGALYVLAMDVAMDRISERDIKELEKCLQKMEAYATKIPPDIKKYRQFHLRFHETIIEIAQNGRLRQIWLSLNNQLHRFSHISFSNPKHLQTSIRFHREILEAIKTGNKEQAKKLTYDHALEGFKNLQEILKSGA